MSPESALFPLYQLMDAFEAFSHGEPDVKPQHRSLYYFLLGYARKRGNVPRFALPYEAGMHGSSIGSWATYDAAIKALHGWGFIVYTPGANRYKVPVVELTFRNPSGDELLDYWQSYCLAHPVELQNQSSNQSVELQNRRPTANPTDNSTANPSGDIKKTFRHKTNDTSASAESEQESSFQNPVATASPPAEAGKPSPVLGAGGPNVPFEEFWQAYGKKTGRHKSELKWKGLTPAERAAAMEALPAYVASKPELQFRKDPLSWLNGKHWQDEPPAPIPDVLRTMPAAPPPRPAGPPPAVDPELNLTVTAAREAHRQAEADERARRFRETHANTAAT